MSKTPAKQASKGLVLTAKLGETEEQTMSRAALQPSVNGASVIHAYQKNVMGEVDLAELVTGLQGTIEEVNRGDLRNLEAMLLTQATALQSMFTSLARRASHQEQLKHYGVFMGLALKAQAQSRATISALVDLKYPRQATFIKQANVAHGPQQVNNGPAPGGTVSHAEETKPDHPELLEQHHGEWLDTRATGATSGVDPQLATVETVNRAENTGGQGEGRTQRRPRRRAG